MRTLPLSAAVLAAALLFLTATSADAAVNRRSEDPCSHDGQLIKSPYRQAWYCKKQFEIPPHRTMVDPDSSTCPAGYANHDDLIFGGWGDYWTYRGEWVTWSPSQGTHVHLKGVNPAYHNWGSWNWPTRTLLDCSSTDLAVMSIAGDHPADPGPQLLGAGDDVDRGTTKDDDERGGTGDDTLGGGKGDDELLGGPGKDHLYGGAGDDELFDDHGEDVLHAGPGNDRLSTKDGNHDVVDCGPGEDIAVGDAHDTFTHCEHVYTNAGNTPAEPPVI